MAKYVYGIDLGTTYSCIAYVDESGRANVIKNAEGTNTTPSVVNFASPSEVIVGQVAKDNAVIDPDNTVAFVKTLMGKSDYATSYNGEDKSPEEVSAYILRKVVNDAAEQIQEEVKDVVITCPAYFGTAERQATKNAGIIAGLNVLEIINEPTAAAMYYGCAKEQGNKVILVYDLGGGTFDVTIMKITPETIEVICADGNHELGGKDWDAAIIRYLASEINTQAGREIDFDSDVLQDMQLKAEKAKQQLTLRQETPIVLDVEGDKYRITLSRDKFDEITSSLLNESMEKTDAAINIAKEKGYSIDEILLVGGSTRMPQVKNALKDKYGIEPIILEPDEAVAKGAAIHAVNVYVNNQKSIASDNGVTTRIGGANKELNAEDYKEELSVKPEMMRIGGKAQKVVNATTKSFAVSVVNNENREVCNNLIIKNQPMPDGIIKAEGDFGTLEANQDCVLLEVYESDFMDEYYDVDKDFLLGEATLDLPPNLPEGAPIQVIFCLNSEGILEVTGIDKTSGNEIHVTMQTKGVMSDDKVNELKEKSKKISIS